MSVAEITSRIQQLESQLALLGTPPGGAAATSAGFAAALDAATGTTGTTLDGTGSGMPTDGRVSGDDVVAEARKYLGLPYVWGGTDPQRGMDCSGLVQVVYKSLGYDLPRVSYQQAGAGRPVASMAEAKPGDLIAWDNSSRNNGVDHIAIYIGGGKMIEAPRTGLDIRVVDVPTTPDVIRRILPDGAAAPSFSATQVAGPSSATSATSASAGRASGSVSGVPYADLFNAAARRHGVSADLLSAVAKQESGYNPRAVSPAGAQGLMQLMPGTAKGLGVRDAFDPAQAVDGAARMLRGLIDSFGRTDLALAAYNAGPGAVRKYDGIPPYAETQTYVRKVMSTLGGTR